MYVNEYWLGIISGFIGTFAVMILISLFIRKGKP